MAARGFHQGRTPTRACVNAPRRELARATGLTMTGVAALNLVVLMLAVQRAGSRSSRRQYGSAQLLRRLDRCNAKGPALTCSERAGPNRAIRNAASLGCLNARDEGMVDAATSQPGPQRDPEDWRGGASGRRITSGLALSSQPLTCAGSEIATNPGDQGSAAQCGQGQVRPDIEGHGAPPRSHWAPQPQPPLYSVWAQAAVAGSTQWLTMLKGRRR